MKLKDMSFEELVDYVTQRVHIGLLEGGSKRMRSEIHMWLGQTILWAEQQHEKEKSIR